MSCIELKVDTNTRYKTLAGSIIDGDLQWNDRDELRRLLLARLLILQNKKGPGDNLPGPFCILAQVAGIEPATR